MSDIKEPELNLIERVTRNYILRLLPSSFEHPAEVDDESLDLARSILAKQYVRHGNIGFLTKTFVMLLAYDLAFRLDAMIYGLVFGILGSISLALTNMYTPELLAEELAQEPQSLRGEIESKAKRSVKTNVGVVGLIVGFLWQIFTISGPIPSELIYSNYLQGVISNWIGFAAVLLIGFIFMGKGRNVIYERLQS